MRSSTVQGAGLTLAVHELGDAASTDQTVVLVHGYPDTHEVWLPVAERLAGTGLHVVAADVRGAGESEAPHATAGYRMQLLIDDIAAVVDATSPDRPVHLVGHDWGSIQAWEAAASPGLRGRIAGLTSISGPPLAHAGAWMRDRLHRRDVRALASQGLRSSYILGFHLPGAPGLARLLGRRDAANGMSLYRANIGGRMRRPEPFTVPVPVLLVVARRDPFVPPRLLEGIEAFAPDLRRVEVDAGHWVVRSDPDEVATAVASFVHDCTRRLDDLRRDAAT